MELLTTIASNFPIPSWLATSAFIICATWLIVGIIIRISKFVDKTNGSNCLLESIQIDTQSTNKKLSLLIEKFNTLIATLAEKNLIDNPELFSMNSPINLTLGGIELVKKVGWEKSLSDDNNKKILFESLDKLQLKTKYDVEKYSIVLLTELAGARDDNPYTPIKKYLYENANQKDFNVLTACAIYLRDKYLESHLEIME